MDLSCSIAGTGELGYDGPLYDGFLHMTDDMLGPSPMHNKYLSYVYDGFCIWRTNFPGPIESSYPSSPVAISQSIVNYYSALSVFLIKTWATLNP